MAITPDTKNWTWVLERACPECGFDSSAVSFAEVPDLIRANVIAWGPVLVRDDICTRPDDRTWSPLEYAAHVRDVFRIFRVRLRAMREEDDPAFANWDQDATAEAERYNEQDPAIVGAQLADDGEALARDFESTRPDELSRTGRRSDGSVFTVGSLALYFMHDPIHHLWDVTG